MLRMDTGMLSSTMLVPCWPLLTLHMVAIGGYECRLDWILLLRSFSADNTRRQKDFVEYAVYTTTFSYLGKARLNRKPIGAMRKFPSTHGTLSWKKPEAEQGEVEISAQRSSICGTSIDKWRSSCWPRQGQNCTEHADTNRCFRCKKICGIRSVLQQISTKT